MRILNPLASCGHCKSASLKDGPYRTGVGPQTSLIGNVPAVLAPFTRASLVERAQHSVPLREVRGPQPKNSSHTRTRAPGHNFNFAAELSQERFSTPD